MKILLLEDDEAYNKLKLDIQQIFTDSLSDLITDLRGTELQKKEEKYCNSVEAMQILGVKSTSMQVLRDGSPENGIIITRPAGKKKILYDRQSLYKYLDSKRQT